jgi:hypothetical protein
MILTADEVLRSLKGSLRLVRRHPDGLRAFDASVEGFWRSFAAILLAAPAFIVLLADQELRAGRLVAGGLFADAWFVAREAAVFVAPWVLFPLFMLGFVRIMGLERRYVGYIVIYNWSGVIAAAIFAVPALLHVLGLATGAHAAFYTFAFSIILVQYRWFFARASLGLSADLAAAVVAADFILAGAAAAAIRALPV